jgi:hypothetical protein
MIEPNDSRLVFMPEADVLKAKGFVMAYHDYWFSCHPEKGLIFYSTAKRPELKSATPQANSTEHISKDLTARLYPWALIKQFPLVLVPVDPKNY